MRRILVMVLHNFFLVPVYWIKLCYHARHAEKYTDEQHYEMIQTIVHRANKGGHVQVDSYGVENLPKEQGFMLYPNHQGLYDTLAIADAFPYPFFCCGKKKRWKMFRSSSRCLHVCRDIVLTETIFASR